MVETMLEKQEIVNHTSDLCPLLKDFHSLLYGISMGVLL
jgi:hypothetical protein